MTPLARRCLTSFIRYQKARRTYGTAIELKPYNDPVGFFDALPGVHCFDLTEIVPLITQTLSQAEKGSRAIDEMQDAACFLPAPRTFLEWGFNEEGTARAGLLLVGIDENTGEAGNDWAKVFQSSTKEDGSGLQLPLGAAFLPLGTPSAKWHEFRTIGTIRSDSEVLVMMAWARIALALINTPRIIGRRQHMPQFALEKKLLANKKLVRHFPLHAWTEIKLEVTPTIDCSDAEPVEAHLTGQKALHFCRAHLRVRLGRVEIVRAHWRGDPSLGVKRSRYTVIV